MELSESELTQLYGESSVTDYQPETVEVNNCANELMAVVVYNLPLNKLTGQNTKYAQQLAKIAVQVGLPTAYVELIKSFNTGQSD
jgi:hypothetical protein